MNDAPEFDDTGPFSIVENTTAVGAMSVTDVDSKAFGFDITGGADQSRFAIDAGTGALSFIAAPDFETPGSAAGTNSYEVEVSVSDETETINTTITVDVTNDPTDDAPALNPIIGTTGRDVLFGTAGADAFFFNGGFGDIGVGGGGNDVFNFGVNMTNGVQDNTRIIGWSDGDSIAGFDLSDVNPATVLELGTAVRFTYGPDKDVLLITGDVSNGLLDLFDGIIVQGTDVVCQDMRARRDWKKGMVMKQIVMGSLFATCTMVAAATAEAASFAGYVEVPSTVYFDGQAILVFDAVSGGSLAGSSISGEDVNGAVSSDGSSPSLTVLDLLSGTTVFDSVTVVDYMFSFNTDFAGSDVFSVLWDLTGPSAVGSTDFGIATFTGELGLGIDDEASLLATATTAGLFSAGTFKITGASEATVIPLPASAVLLLAGIGGLGVAARRKS